MPTVPWVHVGTHQETSSPSSDVLAAGRNGLRITAVPEKLQKFRGLAEAVGYSPANSRAEMGDLNWPGGLQKGCDSAAAGAPR